jgi:hypothetical protein
MASTDMKQSPSTKLQQIALVLMCSAASLWNQAFAQVTPSTMKTDCNHLTQLNPKAPGSPTNLIKLPNRDPGVSELAALMRNIYDALVSQKTALEANQPLPALTDFTRASCAWPTDPNTRTAQFDGFAHVMNATLAQHASKQTEASYNQVITTCLACHQHYCPGPVGAIEDLLLTRTSMPSTPQPKEACN